MKIIIKKNNSIVKVIKQHDDNELEELVMYDFKGNVFKKEDRIISTHSARGYLKNLRINHVDENDSDDKIVKLMKHAIKLSKYRGYSIKSLATMMDDFGRLGQVERLLELGFDIKDLSGRAEAIYNVKDKFILEARNMGFSLNYILYGNINRFTLDFISNLCYKFDRDISYMCRFYNDRQCNNTYIGEDIFRELKEIEELSKEVRCDANVLVDYFYRVVTFEGKTLSETMSHWVDYIRMNLQMGKTSRKIDKYPRFLTSVHDITVMIFNRYKKKHDEEIFKTRYSGIYNFTDKKYSIVEPTNTMDILNEGRDMNNCVGSYIDSIIRGTTLVVFMRENTDLDDSFITVEIKNNSIVQVEGKGRRKPSDEENDFLYTFAKNKNLTVSYIR